jgi:hypothetical protein
VITSAHLSARGESRARPLAARIDREPKVRDDEETWIARALDAVRELR